MVLSRKFTFECDQIENIQINLSLDENDFKFQLFSDFLTKHVFLKSNSLQQSSLGKSKCFKDPLNEIFESGNNANRNQNNNTQGNYNNYNNHITKPNNGNFKVNENLLQNFKVFSNSNINNINNNNLSYNSNNTKKNSYQTEIQNCTNYYNNNFKTIEPEQNFIFKKINTYRDPALYTDQKLLDNSGYMDNIEKDFKTLTEGSKNSNNMNNNNFNANKYVMTANKINNKNDKKASKHKKYLSMNELFHINQEKVISKSFDIGCNFGK